MKLDRWIAACVILLGATVPGSLAGEGRPGAPPGSLSSDTPEARWIRKFPQTARLRVIPTAPLPVIPTAPLPVLGLAAAPAITEAPDGGEAPAAKPGVTLAELEEIALANNPTIVQAQAQILAARAKCLQVGLYPNPVIGYQGEEIGALGTFGQQGAFFRQEIVTAGKLGRRRAVVAREIEQAEHAWQAQRGRVLNDLRVTWYDVLVAQRTVELHQQLVRIGQQGIKAAEVLLAALEVSKVDLLQALTEAGLARFQLDGAQNRHLAAWRRLAAVLGMPGMEPTPLAGDLDSELPQLTWEESLPRLLAESPELAGARAGVRRARSAVARESAEWVPNIDVEASVRYGHPTSDTLTSIEFSLPLPIFNRNQGNIRKSQAELIAAKNELRRVELALQDRLAAVFERFASARHRTEKYALSILPNAKESLDLVHSGYQKGEFDYLTLLTAQRTYTRVSLAYLESLREVRATGVLIEGLLLTGGLVNNE